MELERILHKQGFGSRKVCRAMIRAGRVVIAGEVVDDPFVDYPTEGLAFLVDDVPWTWRETATLMLHKPAGYECSRNPIHHPSIFKLLPQVLVDKGIQPIGRLDEDTTGLLIFTDDGKLNHRLSSPKRKVPKTYVVTTKHPVDQAQIDALLEGVLLNDEPELLRAAACRVLPDGRLEMTITEGKYHQVKRMVAAAGNRVEALARVKVGQLDLPAELAEGQWRWLSDEELALLESGKD